MRAPGPTAVLVLIGALAAVAMGCSRSKPPDVPRLESDPQTPVLIRLWTFQQSALDVQAAQEGVRQRFEELNPHLRVQVETFPVQDYREKLLAAIREGNPPDVAALDQIWMAEFAASGALLPLDELLGWEAQAKLFFRGAWETCLYQGHVWGIPFNYDGWMLLYYNKESFRRAGLDPERPPTTWRELFKQGQALTHPPHEYGLALIGSPDEGLVVSINAFIYSNGGEVVDPASGRVLIDQREAVEALAFYEKLTAIAPPGTERRDEAGAVELFSTGRTAMALLGAWQQDTFRLRAPTLDWGVAPLPAPPGKPPRSTAGGWNLGILARSPHAAEAFQYIAFLSRTDVQPEVTSLMPARREAGRKFVRKRRLEPDVVLYMNEQGKPRPVHPAYSRISTIQQRMMQRIFAGTPPQEAAVAARTELESLIH